MQREIERILSYELVRDAILRYLAFDEKEKASSPHA